MFGFAIIMHCLRWLCCFCCFFLVLLVIFMCANWVYAESDIWVACMGYGHQRRWFPPVPWGPDLRHFSDSWGPLYWRSPWSFSKLKSNVNFYCTSSYSTLRARTAVPLACLACFREGEERERRRKGRTSPSVETNRRLRWQLTLIWRYGY